MSEKFEATYYVDNGYAGSHGAPHTLRISPEDVEGMSDDSLIEMLEEEMQTDFEQSVHPYIEEDQRAEFLEWARGIDEKSA